MTIGAWVILIIFAVIGLVFAGLAFGLIYGLSDSGIAASLGAAVVIGLTVAACLVFFWWRTNSASGQRALKDQQSELNGGIERVITVYDIDGDVIAQYSGRFDIETDRQSYILFDDEEGKRHIIYYTTGTITVDEK